MTFSYDLKQVVPVANALGEGLLWRPFDQTLWWTDILGKTLYCLPWGDDTPRKLPLSQRLCAFGLIKGDDTRFIAAFESGFAYLDTRTAEITWLYQPGELTLGGGRRLNDGRVGPDGAFWVGAMTGRDDVSGGRAETWLYRFAGGQAQRVRNGMGISNGLTWSPQGDKIYLSDSMENKIYSADFDKETGAAGEFKSFATPETGTPDGAVTDTNGNYWSALWGGHCVACFDSAGERIADITLPVPQPTIPVFAGPDLDHIAMASARAGLDENMLRQYPQSGHVFIMSVSAKGYPPYAYLE